MKVVIINGHMKIALGGSELQCHLIAEGLAARGHKVTYLVPGEVSTADKKADKWEDLNYDVVFCQDTGIEISKAVIKLVPDVVYWRRNKKNIAKTSRTLVRGGIPLVFAVSARNDLRCWNGVPFRRVSDPVREVYWYFRSFYELRAFRFVTCVTVLNPELQKLVPHKNVFFVANSVPLAREDFAWERPYIVWVANIKPEKRPDEVIALAPVLKERGVDLIMVGAIQHPAYRAVMSEERLPENVFYLGGKTLEQVNGILAGSLFHVHTCMPEGFGNIFIQAWSASRCSVSLGYDPGGYFSRYGIGINAKNDREVFRRAICELIESREKREQLGSEAYRIAMKHFTTERMVDQVEEILVNAVKS